MADFSIVGKAIGDVVDEQVVFQANATSTLVSVFT